MTMLNLYSIFDRKAVSYAPPFVAVNDSVACRMSLASAMGEQNMLADYPADFDVYCLGNLDQESGRITPLNTPVFVVNFAALLQQAQRAPDEQSVLSAVKA